nr:hypothetical protein [uncultured Desulfobulbus sp.]
MKLLQTLKKLKRLRLTTINGKSATLFLLNRRIPKLGGGKARFGSITDLHLDRKNKTIAFEITRAKETNTVTVQGYGFAAHKGQSALEWKSMEFNGPSGDIYRQALGELKRIEIPRTYITLLEAML